MAAEDGDGSSWYRGQLSITRNEGRLLSLRTGIGHRFVSCVRFASETFQRHMT